jgi:toxin ParE1/3/4
VRLVRVLPRADADIDGAADYYVDHAGVEVGLRFLGAVQEAYSFISEHPDAGPRGQYENRRLRELRRWPVPGFETYLVFYRLIDECIEIVRVLHGARDLEELFDAE